MEESFTADRADLSVAEKSCQRKLSQDVGQRYGIMVRYAEKSFPAPGAGEEQDPNRPRQPSFDVFRSQNEVFAGGLRITQLELDSLANPRMSAHSERADLRVCPQNVADQKIALLEVVDVFGDRQAEEQVISEPKHVARLGC